MSSTCGMTKRCSLPRYPLRFEYMCVCSTKTLWRVLNGVRLVWARASDIWCAPVLPYYISHGIYHTHILSAHNVRGITSDMWHARWELIELHRQCSSAWLWKRPYTHFLRWDASFFNGFIRGDTLESVRLCKVCSRKYHRYVWITPMRRCYYPNWNQATIVHGARRDTWLPATNNCR